MDAFYASVEQRDHPELRGKPVIVGGSLRRGVVSAASYEVRKFGVHSAMPMAEALRRCPQAVVMPVRMARYAEVSDTIFDIFARYTPLVEPLSLDEAFLDVTASQSLFGPAVSIARRIKDEVLARTELTVSAGVAPNKFLAKIASDLEKPDGLTVVPADRIQEFLDPLPINRIWGLGRKTEEIFRKMNIGTIGQLRLMDRDVLVRRFGEMGAHFHLLAQGLDDREVIPDSETKSIGHEDTYETDITDLETAQVELLDLAERVAARLRRLGLRGRTITLKVKYSDFRLITRSVTHADATDDGGRLYREAVSLLSKTQVGRRPVRLLGISVSSLTDKPGTAQLSLLEPAPEDNRIERLNRAVDDIRSRYGSGAVMKSRLLGEGRVAEETPVTAGKPKASTRKKRTGPGRT